MTDVHPESDIPQVDFDIHTGDVLGDRDDTEVDPQNPVNENLAEHPTDQEQS